MNLNEKLDEILELLRDNSINSKSVLDANEACSYLHISKCRLYDLVNGNSGIPYFCNGKKILISRPLLDKWIEEKALKNETI